MEPMNMSWRTLKQSRNSTLSVRLHVNNQNQAFLSIGGSTVARLGWTNETRIEVSIGEGEHAGQLRMERDAGGKRLTQQGASLRLFICHAAKLGLPQSPIVDLDYRVKGGVLEVDLPSSPRQILATA